MMKNLFSRLRALNRIPGFHSLCLTRPLTDFEAATMILSVLTYRNNIGPMTLFVDGPGAEWAAKTGIKNLYDEVRLIDSDPRINARVFWAHGKIAALAEMTAPCVSVDIDAILFRRPPLMTDVVALHSEPEIWNVYGFSPLRSFINNLCERTGRPDKPRTKYAPANTGVLCINDESFRAEYVAIAKHCMLMESIMPTMSDRKVITIDGTPVTQMVLCEQYVLSKLASEMDKNLSFLCQLSLDDDHMVQSNYAMHLWNSKRFYAKHDRARQTYLSWAMENIFTICGKDHDKISAVVRACNLPSLRVNDGNTRSVRWSHSGEWFGPGESVEVFS